MVKGIIGEVVEVVRDAVGGLIPSATDEDVYDPLYSFTDDLALAKREDELRREHRELLDKMTAAKCDHRAGTITDNAFHNLRIRVEVSGTRLAQLQQATQRLWSYPRDRQVKVEQRRLSLGRQQLAPLIHNEQRNVQQMQEEIHRAQENFDLGLRGNPPWPDHEIRALAIKIGYRRESLQAAESQLADLQDRYNGLVARQQELKREYLASLVNGKPKK